MAEGSGEDKSWVVERGRLRRGLVLAVSLSTAALIIIMLATMRKDIPTALSHPSPFYLFLAVFLSLFRWLWSVARMRLLVLAVGGDVPLPRLVKTVFAGSFTGQVTPWRAGGITGEAFFLYFYGLGPGEAAAVVSFGASVSTILLILTLPLAIWLAEGYFAISFTIRGFLFSALTVGLLFLGLVILSLLRPESALDRFILRFSPEFLRRRGGYQLFLARLAEEVRSFSSSLRRMAGLGACRLALVVLLSFLFWVTGFLAMPLILVGLGYGSYFWKALIAQLVVQLLLPFIPIPGGSGLGEIGFLYVYKSVLPDWGIAGLLTLIWRFLDFYLGILVGGVAFLLILRDVNKSPRRAAEKASLPPFREETENHSGSPATRFGEEQRAENPYGDAPG